MLQTQHLIKLIIILIFLPQIGNAEKLAERKEMAPEKVEYKVPTLQLSVVLSHPAYLDKKIEETPYQLLQLCNNNGHCQTLYDTRGKGGFSIASDPELSFSPDKTYFILLQMAGVEPTSKTYRSHYFELYGLKEAAVVSFRTKEGKEATTDNILQWSEQEPHALEISIGRKKKALAYPVSDNDAPVQ